MNPIRAATLDQMTEFALEGLLAGDGRRKILLVREMAERWPSESALAIAFAVASAAESIRDASADGDPGPAVPMGHRLAALVAADVHALQGMGLVPSQARDLLHFWRRVDPLFLRPT
ncbi:hypothetical protein [Rubellimicrobium aerolatum]|uniref:Uncharacterized protein n=1 Tax=Rubellimicrobium aerolatum TaxID=490979 RepID=A0ABW0SAK7_9RHOB|nr:hypothetical protein [Rubellimicrobium aerolatum]MBP1805269.1 hypothetical protein [Rubellimicrobium aerolatum]